MPCGLRSSFLSRLSSLPTASVPFTTVASTLSISSPSKTCLAQADPNTCRPTCAQASGSIMLKMKLAARRRSTSPSLSVGTALRSPPARQVCEQANFDHPVATSHLIEQDSSTGTIKTVRDVRTTVDGR
mmetsp:Transcript_8026/g.17713  ORF Transcript_8026/g.17713 Transcript_8026/m.17713 type:complete len:129 (-) Transcript_8026:290-676(-)